VENSFDFGGGLAVSGELYAWGFLIRYGLDFVPRGTILAED
jgi:hypothetical protein